MTTADPQNDLDPLQRETHRWVALLVSGEATTDDADALRAWLQQSPAHEQAFVSATAQWRNFGPAGRALLEADQLSTLTPPAPLVSRRAMLGGLSIAAACVGGYAVVRPPLNLWPSLSELTADFRTAKGEQRRIVLADNVSMRLNTDTSVSIAGSTRSAAEVELITGEAVFEVPARSGRSLAVLSGDGRSVTMKGRFEVRNFGSAICVTCYNGDVSIAQGSESATIRANQQLRYDDAGLQPVRSVDTEEVAAWQQGVLVFRLTPPSDVIAEINRYRPGRVILMNSELGTNPVNARFRIQRIDEALLWIEQAFGAKARSLPGGIVLLS